ncbi:U3 small nucleolar ribonucleoprotein complex, subunit Mpp10, partial [Lactarius hatsudake]
MGRRTSHSPLFYGRRLQDDHGLRYADFFDTPNSGAAKEKSEDPPFASAHSKARFHDEVKVKTIKARGKGLPVSTIRLLDDASDDDDSWEVESEDEDEDDLEGAIWDHVLDGDSDMVFGGGGDESGEGSSTFDGYHAIKRSQDDLLADEDEPDDGMSTHEKRLTSLQRQITALEAKNVTSRIRLHDPLLEDLEFERVMKAIPVITEEIVSGFEDRIKARILEGHFDDVVRKRPVDDKPFLPSRFFELQDTKSKQSLAQVYEEEYTATQTGGEAISSKLDALSNAHFTPKTSKATISIVANVSSTSLEPTLPTSNMFARGLSPREKRTARNKLKKAKKKARDSLQSRVTKELGVKGKGVTVI